MRVGRYEILEIIGAGTNGSVVRAHDPMIGRLVAIKLLPPEMAKGEAQNRFLQEARVVGAGELQARHRDCKERGAAPVAAIAH